MTSLYASQEKQFTYNTIDKKVFSTADWASKQTQTTTEGPKNIDVTFKVSSSADNANRITMNDVFEFSKVRKGPQINETVTKNLEYGKVYTLNLTGRKLKTKGEQVLAMEDSSDEDYNDIECSTTLGKFYDISGTTCKFSIPTPPPLPKQDSTIKQDGNRAKVFNTIDFINKSNSFNKIFPGFLACLALGYKTPP